MRRRCSGDWRLESKTDPRFNLQGRGSDVHLYKLPAEAKALLHFRVAELGVSPPEDLEYVCVRDLDPSEDVPVQSFMN